MNSIQAEITQRVLELMAYIHSVTGSESEYESLLSQAAMELLDEAVLFEDSNMDTDNAFLLDAYDPIMDNSPMDDNEDDWDDDEDILAWEDEDDWFGRLSAEDDLDDDNTEYRQQADGRVL